MASKSSRKARNLLRMARPDLYAEIDKSRIDSEELEVLGTGSSRSVWWQCNAGHSYQARISARCTGNLKCPFCSGLVPTPGKNDLATTHPEVASQLRRVAGSEVSAREIFAGSNRKAEWQCANDPEHIYVARIIDQVNAKVGCPFCSFRRILPGNNDLLTTHPKLSEEWDFEQNNGRLPRDAMMNSPEKVAWICSSNPGHRWLAAPRTRVRLNSGCPYCSNQRILPGDNDLATRNPEVAQLWDAHLNQGVTASEVGAGSGKKGWWRCAKISSHTWQRVIAEMNSGKSDCPYCSGSRVEVGSTDLPSVHPDLIREWDFEANEGQSPVGVPTGSHLIVHWKCSKSKRHKWTAAVGKRAAGQGCPYCAGRIVDQGVNDLATANTKLAAEWHPTRNGQLEPNQLHVGSHKKIWWQCSKDPSHEWQAQVVSRHRGNGCPICSGRLISPGVNDLKTLRPDLYQEVDFDSHSESELAAIGLGASKIKLWWICKSYSNHRWQASPNNRANHSSGCPVCANLQILPGFNDLATVTPHLAEQWDYEKNGSLMPNQVAPNSGKKVWWVCPNDSSHSWLATVKNRAFGRGCNACAPTGYQPSKAGVVYLIQNDDLLARKVGITNPGAKTDRLQAFRDLGWQVVFTSNFEDGYVPMAIETMMLHFIRKVLGLPPYLSKTDMPGVGGFSETFSIYGPTNQELVEKLNEFSVRAIDNLAELRSKA